MPALSLVEGQSSVLSVNSAREYVFVFMVLTTDNK